MTPQLQRFFWVQAILPSSILFLSALPWAYHDRNPGLVLPGALVSVCYFFVTALINLAVLTRARQLPFRLMYASFLVGPAFLFMARTRLDYAILVPVILLHVLLAGWQQGRVFNDDTG